MEWYWLFVAAVMAMFIGWRHEVGGDWISYLVYVDDLVGESVSAIRVNNDPAYAVLNWIGANVFGDVYFTNIVSGIIFTGGLFYFCKKLSRPWLGLFVAIPYLVNVVAMGYTRQGVAIGLAMVAIAKLLFENNAGKFLIWIALAAAFHKSAVVLILVALLAGSKGKWLKFFMVAVSAPFLFVLLLQESMDSLVRGYIEAEYSSAGADIRVFMNALPACLFLVFKNRFELKDEHKVFWTWISLLALAFVLLLKISPSSTAVDRLALYWIPLQILVWSSIPDVLGRKGGKNYKWSGLVISSQIFVLMVWLFFSNNSDAWIPYKFYPWEWIWS
ncbi:EpsG family protein [Ideonella paludis]|nr:EpsG family protein [Ideonella paludis]